MSSFLEFRQKAYKIPVDAPTAKWAEASAKYGIPSDDIFAWGDRHIYFIFVEGGDNNVVDYDGKVARRWLIAAAGTWLDAFGRICRIAADYVLGGMVCFRTRVHWTKPENYISRYREVIEAASGIDDLLGGRILEFAIYQLPESEKTHPWHKEVLDSGRLSKASSDGEHYTLRISPHRDEAIADLCWLATQCTLKGDPLFRLAGELSI